MSDWINFVKDFADANNLSYGDALKEAKHYYKKPRQPRANRKSNKNKYYTAGKIIGEMLGGAAPKGALAALLSGLDARVKIM